MLTVHREDAEARFKTHRLASEEPSAVVREKWTARPRARLQGLPRGDGVREEGRRPCRERATPSRHLDPRLEQGGPLDLDPRDRRLLRERFRAGGEDRPAGGGVNPADLAQYLPYAGFALVALVFVAAALRAAGK